jgi:carboxymethylenebutenolidase
MRKMYRLMPLSCLGLLAVAATAVQSLPPGEVEARERLNSSPRHGEWAVIEDGDDLIRAWVVYPERSTPAPVVVVIHEIYGLTDWIRSVADQLAADGFLAVAPDLLSGKGPGGGGTESVDRDGAVGLVRGLEAAEVNRRLTAAARYGTGLSAATSRFATLGFCWGGRVSFAYGAANPELAAAVVYYGSSPEEAVLSQVSAPVLGLYGEDDARVNTTIEPAAEVLKRLGRSYETHIFPGAGHGFLRAQDGREGANRRAAEQAWPLTVEFLRRHLGG